jgi:hypothetical protein
MIDGYEMGYYQAGLKVVREKKCGKFDLFKEGEKKLLFIAKVERLRFMAPLYLALMRWTSR